MIRPNHTVGLLILVTATAILAAAAPALAAVPRTIAFQGFLTDAGGQPAGGVVNLDFAVYNVATGGTALWTETHAAVPVNQGVFAVALGSVSPLNGAVANSSPRFIGIRVNGEVELPRTELRAAPFALRAQAADSVTTGINIKQGNVSALSSQYSTQGELNLEWRCQDFNQMVARLGAGFNGDGTLLLYSNSGATSLEAYSSRFGNPFLGLYGAVDLAFIDLDQASDSSIRFPVGGINSVESYNEPGLASATNTNFTSLTAAVASVLSRTLTPPSGGYVLALGQCVARITHTSGTATNGAIGLSDDGLGFGTAQDVNVQISSGAASGSYSIPVHLNGVFAAAADIPVTIHLMGSESSGAIEVEDVSLTLLYVPTSYGTVSQTLLASEDGEESAAQGTQSAAEIADEVAASRRANDDRIAAETAAQLAAHAARLAELEARLDRIGSQER
ncbi:MAG: hypothetical protein IPK64_03810 [bacterium]|nr:hypothetical protein [bacterium]